MRVIDEKGEQVGVLSTQAAIDLAKEREKDLILIAPQASPPVAKIIEESKYKYQQQQRKQEVRKASKASDIKEVRLSPFIATGDLESRIKRAKSFLEDGDKVRFLLRFKGREITKKEFGENVMDKVIESLEEVSQVETAPKLQGKVLSMQLMPAKKKKN